MSDTRYTCYEGKVQYCQPRQGFIRCNIKIEGKRDIIFFTEEIPESIRNKVRTGIRVRFYVVKSNPRTNCVGKTINHWAKIIEICEDDGNSSQGQKPISNVSMSRYSPEFIPKAMTNGLNEPVSSSDIDSTSSLQESCYSDGISTTLQSQQSEGIPMEYSRSLRDLSHRIMQRVAESIYFKLNRLERGVDYSQQMRSSCWDMYVHS